MKPLNNKPEEPKYAEVFKYHLQAIAGMIEAVFLTLFELVVGTVNTILSKMMTDGIEILFRAIPLFAPIPNAVSIFKISVSYLNFTFPQALGASLVIELTLFFLIWVTTEIWGKYLYNKVKYRLPFYLMIITTIIVAVMMVALLGILEHQSGGHPIIAIFPLFSLASFMGIGIRGWSDRDDISIKEEKEAKRQERLTRSQPILKPIATDSKTDSKTDLPVVAQPIKGNDFRALQLAMLPIYQANPLESIGSMATKIGSNKTAVRNALTDLESKGVVEIVKLTKGQKVTVNGKYDQFMEGE